MSLHIDHISKKFGDKIVLDGLNLRVERGQIVTLFGPNGCGKSTLLNIITGLLKPDAGQIHLDEADRIGMVFQDYRRHLLPWRSARANILFPLQLQKLSAAQQKTALDDILQIIPIPFDLDQPVISLSGGQAQLVSLVRALIIKPTILLLDEPFSALDYATSWALRDVVTQAARALNLAVLSINHDLEEALYMGDRMVFLTARPAHIAHELAIDLPWPRTRLMTALQPFNALKQQALALL